MTTDRQVFMDTTAHRRPARILYYAGFTPDLLERVQAYVGEGNDIREHFGYMRRTGLALQRPEGLPELDYGRYWEHEELPEGTTINKWGVAQAPSGFYHFWGYISPLRNAKRLSELEHYPLDDLRDWDGSYLDDMAQAAHNKGDIVVGWVGHMYETAWQIRGYEQFLMDMVERPAWAECLLERLFQQNLVKARAFARAGADWLQCGDDVANQRAMTFAPATWRKMMLSRWSQVWAAAKEINPKIRIWYHSDGNIAPVAGELIEAGVDILNPIQPECVDTDDLYRRYGDRLTLDGTIGTQTTMPFGSPEDVRERVHQVIKRYGQNGGLIVSPTHVLEPEVPIANIQAMADACREFGTFA